MKTAERPIDDMLDQTVLDRIDMDVIDMTAQIRLITNPVLPKAPLPDAGLSMPDLARAARRRLGQAVRKVVLDKAPAKGEFVIPLRQPPQRMNVIGKHTDSDGFKRMRRGHRPVCLTKALDFGEQKIGAAVCQSNGKEVHAAGGAVSSVVAHG